MCGAADTSVVVAAFASWHENHEPARRALDEGLKLIEHCALETYSVLTRLPPPHRASGDIVREFIAAPLQHHWRRRDLHFELAVTGANLEHLPRFEAQGLPQRFWDNKPPRSIDRRLHRDLNAMIMAFSIPSAL